MDRRVWLFITSKPSGLSADVTHIKRDLGNNERLDEKQEFIGAGDFAKNPVERKSSIDYC